MSVSLRKFPYPYRAGLAVANDADSMTEESFRFVHRFLNSTKDTQLGPGLALPISDSLFLFRSLDDPNRFTFFEGISDRPSRCAGFLRDCVVTGLIDTLHTYGAFSSARDFSRGLAARGIDALDENGMRIRVWVNHGPRENVQCFGVPTAPHCLGDDPDSDFYHTDLTLRYGIEYCWAGSEFGELIAHDSGWHMPGVPAYAAALLRHLCARRRPAPKRRLLNLMTLRDGGKILGFERYWGTRGQAPVVDNIARQLSARNLRRLKQSSGFTIVYQHFAVRRKAPGFGVDKYMANSEPYFRPEECAAFIRLAEEYHNGNILVAPTERLLRYNRTQRWLRWRAEETGSIIKITLLGVKVPGFLERVVHRAEIEGLTFYSTRPEETYLCIQTDSGAVPVTGLIRNPKDHTGRESVMVPVSSHEVPDL